MYHIWYGLTLAVLCQGISVSGAATMGSGCLRRSGIPLAVHSPVVHEVRDTVEYHRNVCVLYLLPAPTAVLVRLVFPILHAVLSCTGRARLIT